MQKRTHNFKELLSLRNVGSTEIIDRFAPITPSQFNYENGTPVIMSSCDGKDLPLLLVALGRSSMPLAPIVIDNRPAQGIVREYAEAMGAVVIDEETPGQMKALQTGIEHTTTEYPDTPMFLIDDDCLPPAKWAETMMRRAQLHRELGGIAYGGIVLEHGESMLVDSLRTTYALATNIRRKLTHSSPKARGPNGILQLDQHGRITEELYTQPAQVFPCDVAVQEGVKAAGGEVKATLHPYAFTFTRGDRFSSVGSLVKDVKERGKKRADLYEND